jgi:hypothetical protein
MTDISTKIMVEVLMVFGIATKELRRGSASKFSVGHRRVSAELCVEKFLKKLAGKTDLEDAVKRLDRLTQEEARMVLAEVLRITHSVRDKVQCVDERVQVVIDGTRGASNQSPMPSDMQTFRRKGGKSGGEGNKNHYPTDLKHRRRN